MHLSDMSLSVTIGLPIQVCNLYSTITSENVRVHPTQHNTTQQSVPQNENHKRHRLIIPHEYLPHCGKHRRYHTEDRKQSAVTKARNDSIQEHHAFESRLD
jgi:hypothetical protein